MPVIVLIILFKTRHGSCHIHRLCMELSKFPENLLLLCVLICVLVAKSAILFIIIKCRQYKHGKIFRIQFCTCCIQHTLTSSWSRQTLKRCTLYILKSIKKGKQKQEGVHIIQYIERQCKVPPNSVFPMKSTMASWQNFLAADHKMLHELAFQP